MHDIFACSCDMHKKVKDCQVVDSDHSPIRLKINLASIKFKGSTISRGVIDWTKVLTDDRYLEMYNMHLLDLVDDTISYEVFNECIKSGRNDSNAFKKEM